MLANIAEQFADKSTCGQWVAAKTMLAYHPYGICIDINIFQFNCHKYMRNDGYSSDTRYTVTAAARLRCLRYKRYFVSWSWNKNSHWKAPNTCWLQKNDSLRNIRSVDHTFFCDFWRFFGKQVKQEAQLPQR